MEITDDDIKRGLERYYNEYTRAKDRAPLIIISVSDKLGSMLTGVSHNEMEQIQIGNKFYFIRRSRVVPSGEIQIIAMDQEQIYLKHNKI